MAKGQNSRKESKKPSAKKKAKTASPIATGPANLQTEPVVVGKKVKEKKV